MANSFTEALRSSESDQKSSASAAVSHWQQRILPLALALAIVAGAWVIGGRQGFDRIGTGGQNLRLLPKIGDAAPDFVAPTVVGEIVRLADLRGQPVWLNFWGSWCPPCRSEFPEMQAAYAKALQPNGVVLLAVSLDEPPEAAAGFAARNNGTFPILTDPDRAFTGAAYPIANFPTHILIDREGIVRDVVLAPIDEAEIVRRAQVIIGTEEAP
jgi:peroxiredoxin